MPLESELRKPAGRAFMTVLSFILAPLVVFAYKYIGNVKSTHWILWVVLDAFLWLTGLGGFDPFWQWARGAWDGNMDWPRLSIQSVLPFGLAIAVAIFVVWQTEITGPSRAGNGNSQSQNYGDDQGYSLSKRSRRHFEKVSNARAQAAAQLKRDILRGEV
ncbi:hypothetical protein JCM5350_007093 [Sporobolomyces pararoseus]